MILEFVLSGMTIGAPSMLWSDNTKLSPYKNIIQDKILKLRASYSRQELSLLFNSFTEPKHGQTMKEMDLKFMNLFSDSGGLQMITTKFGISEELKEKVYIHQAQYSDKAFIFDEIPLYVDKRIVNGTQSKNNSQGKYFIKDYIIPSAIRTSKNIKSQVKIFDSLNSDTKLFLIAQGQDKDSINTYVNTIMRELSDYEKSRIYGVALSSACLGTRLMERYDMIYNYINIDLPDNIKKNVHLLGVGNIVTIFPFIFNKEYFSYIQHLSYDSTRQTNSYLFKRYTDSEHITYKLNGNMKSVHKCISEIYERNRAVYESLGAYNYEFLLENATKYSKSNIDNKIKYITPNCSISENIFNMTHFFWNMEVVDNFRFQVERMLNNNFDNKHIVENKQILMLKNIKTYDDYLNWRRFITLPSDRIKIVNHIDEINKNKFIDGWL